MDSFRRRDPAFMPRVLVPVLRGQTAGIVLQLGDGLAIGGTGGVLGLVEVGFSAGGQSTADRARDLIRWIAAVDRTDPPSGSRLAVKLRVTRDIRRSVRDALHESSANLIILQLPAPEDRRPHGLQRVIADLVPAPPAGLVFVRPARLEAGSRPVRSVLVAVRGGANARLAIWVAGVLAGAHRARLTIAHVYDSAEHPGRRSYERDLLTQLVSTLEVPVSSPCMLEIEAEEALPALLPAARDSDLVILGATAASRNQAELLSPEMSRFLGEVAGTVLVAKAGGCWSAAIQG
jgi:hypothetical protein